MTPDQIQLAIKAAIIALVLAAAAAGGWTLNGWRLSGQLEQLRGEKKVLEDQVRVLGEATRACSAGVDQAKRVGELAVGQIRAHLAELKNLHAAANREAVDRLEALLKNPTPPGAGCDKAWDAIEAERKAGVAP